MEFEVTLGKSEAQAISSRSACRGAFIGFPELEQKRGAEALPTASSCPWERKVSIARYPSFSFVEKP